MHCAILFQNIRCNKLPDCPNSSNSPNLRYSNNETLEHHAIGRQNNILSQTTQHRNNARFELLLNNQQVNITKSQSPN